MKTFDDFDREFKKTQKLAFAGIIISAIIYTSLIVFFIWVVIKLLSHFGIV